MISLTKQELREGTDWRKSEMLISAVAVLVALHTCSTVTSGKDLSYPQVTSGLCKRGCKTFSPCLLRRMNLTEGHNTEKETKASSRAGIEVYLKRS